MEKHELIIAQPRACPNPSCGRVNTGVPNMDYKCPICEFEFCNVCSETHVTGKERYIFCPKSGCGMMLHFPSEAKQDTG